MLPLSTPSGHARDIELGPCGTGSEAPLGCTPPGLGCFGGPRADIYPSPGVAWKRASSAQCYFKSRGLAAAPGLNYLAQQGAAGGAEPDTQGRAPRESAEPRVRLQPCWCLAPRQKMLLAAGGANSPGTERNSQGEWWHFLHSWGISSLLAPAPRSHWPCEPGRHLPWGRPTAPIQGQILGAEGVSTQGPRRQRPTLVAAPCSPGRAAEETVPTKGPKQPLHLHALVAINNPMHQGSRASGRHRATCLCPGIIPGVRRRAGVEH